MSVILKPVACAAALLVLAGVMPASAQNAGAMPALAQTAAPAPGQASPTSVNYDQDQRCLGVYSFMAASERAVPPATIQAYAAMIAADGRALGKSDDGIKDDMKAAMTAYTQNVIVPMSKDNQIPADAGWADYESCNSYFAGRGIEQTNTPTPQPQ